MEVNIIIPIYNVSKYITRCLESVASQSYEDISCILVDDCGTDDSMDIVKEFVNAYSGKKRFEIVHHVSNQGQGVARNTGTAASAGDYVYYLDSDDAITPDCIETLVTLARQYPKADFIQGSTVKGDKDFPTYHDPCKETQYADDKETLQRLILSVNIKTVWNRLVKRSFIEENSLFFPEGIANCEDLYWVYFMSKKVTAAAFTSQGTYYYYINANSSSTSASKAYTEKRVLWHYLSVKAIYEDMNLHRAQNGAHQRQFLAGFICNYMMQLCKLKSLSPWMVFWNLVTRINFRVMGSLTWTKLRFFIAVLPPLCFLTDNSSWRWRLRHNIINKID